VTLVEDAFFEQLEDDTFRPTKWTRGPWGPDSQHGGPPAALLGRAIENVNDRADLSVARIVFDILRPVPIEPLTLDVRVARPGKSVELVQAALSTSEHEVMRASAWRIHAEERDLEPTKPASPPAPPSEGVALPPFQTGYEGYLQAMEWVFIEGIFLQEGPATAWMRMRIPLLAGEEPSPLTRVLAAVDSASGISSAVDFSTWLFVNPDLSVYLSRLPRGEWICLDAATTVDKRGIGLAAGRIFDTEGEIGRSLQSLFIAPRNS
jgi:acyl-CoA thioesterase